MMLKLIWKKDPTVSGPDTDSSVWYILNATGGGKMAGDGGILRIGQAQLREGAARARLPFCTHSRRSIDVQTLNGNLCQHSETHRV